MPPAVAAFDPRDGVACAFEDEDVLDVGAGLEGCVDDGLCGDGLAAAATLVGGEDDAAAAVLDAVAEGLGGEAGEDDGVDGADAGAGEEGGDGVPGHGEVEGDGVALADAEGLEDVGEGADLVEELGVGDVGALGRLVGFVDDGGLAAVR